MTHALATVEPVNLEGVFAPVRWRPFAELLEAREVRKKAIEDVAAYVRSGPAMGLAMPYFTDVVKREVAKRQHGSVSVVSPHFDPEQAIKALDASMWDRAMALTDVFDFMPANRRQEWRAAVDEYRTPEFVEESLRSTLQELLDRRVEFFAERVDGVFRALSGEHVTNRPEGFGTRMILAYVYDEWGSPSFRGHAEHLHDFRYLVAKLMGRGDPIWQDTSQALRAWRQETGVWHLADGGSFRIRVYKKGTAHLEVNPEIAWKLNSILAYLHPKAIPAPHRTRPSKRLRDFPLTERPIPFGVLRYLDDGRVTRLAEGEGRYQWGPGYSLSTERAPREVVQEALQVLQALGGVPASDSAARTTVQFDYNIEPVLAQINATGALPDQRAHQFYPTPDDLAQRVVELARIGPEHYCLEPSAGLGALARLMPRDNTLCVEISSLYCEALKARGFHVQHGDFLGWYAGAAKIRQFHRVVMNPPFSEGRWRAHIEHAWRLLAPGGRLVAVVPRSAKPSSLNLPGAALVHPPEEYEPVYPGTSIRVSILVMDKM